MSFLKKGSLALFLFVCICSVVDAQQLMTKRPTFYTTFGASGAKLNQLDHLLADRGLSGLRNRYNTIGLGYQTRINDFMLGAEVLHNHGAVSELDNYKIGYRTSRALLNIGYAFTEESKFQLIHYMSLGVGFLNFQMLPDEKSSVLSEFLADPKQGFVLRKKDIQKGSQKYGNFLTEIGFQLSYDIDLSNRREAIQIISKVGYSFSPIAGKWEMAGVAFDNAQSGAFVRIGAGVSMPDRNFFYKDASIGIALVKAFHFTRPTKFNSELEKAGLNPFKGLPSDFGLKIFGDVENVLYGVEVNNMAMKGSANSEMNHSLNSLRVYLNGGYKILKYRNIGLSAMTGLGYGNIRYTLTSEQRPDFPELFEQRNFDGYLKNSGLMLKPQVELEYGLPMTNRKLFDLVLSVNTGYDLASTLR